jgi:hypothetical protein
MLVISRSVSDIYLWVADFICVDKTRIWGFRPPVPPLRWRYAAPQTPPRKVRFVGNGARFALAPQWESICGWSFSILQGATEIALMFPPYGTSRFARLQRAFQSAIRARRETRRFSESRQDRGYRQRKSLIRWRSLSARRHSC